MNKNNCHLRFSKHPFCEIVLSVNKNNFVFAMNKEKLAIHLLTKYWKFTDLAYYNFISLGY